ncbi:MAG: S8 family serine peptidase [Lachnospiraceae bacterium]|nr:S8 family serine peptidase [Lachnospiraceae bacterium]
MEEQNIGNLLNLALDATSEEQNKSENLETGYDRETQTWEVILRFSGEPQALLAASPSTWSIVILSGGYAIATLPKSQIRQLAELPQVEYIEAPKRLYFSVSIGRSLSCLYPVQAEPFDLYGEGVLVAVIDSGVDYFHPDFRNADGTTRIRAIWDQSAASSNPDTSSYGQSISFTVPPSQSTASANAGTTWSGQNAGPDSSGSESSSESTLPSSSEFPSALVPLRLGHTPAGFAQGLEYTEEDINAALAAGSREAGLALVPEQDLSGHGTEVLGIAAGNGRASGNPYRGVAAKSDILVVKLASPRPDGFPGTAELMQALEYVTRKAEEFAQPVAINLSFGNVYGSHRGDSLLETYIDTLANRGRNVIIVGTGNEAGTGGHISGRLSPDTAESGSGQFLSSLAENHSSQFSSSPAANPSGQSLFSAQDGAERAPVPAAPVDTRIEFLINDYETTMNLQFWKNYADEYEITIIHPNGRRAGPLGENTGTARYRLGMTTLLIYYSEPSPYQAQQEIYIDFIPDEDYVDSGIWQILLTPQRIVTGDYSLWMPDARIRNSGTRFLNSTPDTTMTIPSTASGVIAVGAYDARLDACATFSGRGWPDTSTLCRPDLVAPGVDVTTTAVGGGYISVSGTSFAAPFVTGSAALLMEWGILRGHDPYLYGEKIRAYLHRGARHLPGYPQWPNNQAGYGALCLRDSLSV